MKVLIDENIPLLTLRHLQANGHCVKDVRGTPDQGVADTELWSIAVSEQRLLITTDKGFTAYRNTPHHGILVVRLRQPNRTKIHEAVMLALDRFPETEWPGLLVVVRDTTISRWPAW